jgi:valyl-tRNA synthetase
VRSGPTPYEDTGMTDYDQKTFEEKWQKQWQDTKIYHFDFNSNKPPYSIDVPPRYASGPLHAGHAVHYTHIDFAARYKRMRGYNVFFPLCFDVNGIPIEERVERQLNITRKDIDRHEFTRLCSEFAQKNIATMTNQFIRLGESMDPSIYYQTDAEYYRRVTQISFIELFEKGYIYKGEFPVNWCPRCMTAMADAEVVYADRTTKLNTIKFYFTKPQDEQILKFHGIGKDAHGVYIEIATTRPEMLAACQIVAVHPTDERAPWLVGQTVKVPTVDKEVKIVEDEAVDPEFGSGLVMICTVGDKEDLNWVFKYKLPLEMSIDEEGRMTAITGKYKGMKIEDARKAVIEDMTTNKLLLKQEPLAQNVGVCWRCKTPVEFINAKQWFLKTIPFKQMVLDTSNAMHWYPEFMKIRLEDWVNSLEWDWVISRQRYFATPIPLWECERCGEVVLARPEDCYIDPTIDKPPVENCPKCGGPLKGCEDVFDTWMDSSISPLYNTFWHRDDKKFSQLYPMSLRPQAHDIIRTWAFYTILRCTLLTDEKPFENIMMGGFILSEDGTPMHASLGNVIDPLQVIDEYGTDAFRCYAASCALGEDNPFRRKDVVRGTKLLRKLWNVQQFIGNIITEEGKPKKPRKLQDIDQWILTKYSKLVNSCTEKMDAFDYSPAMKEIEYFLWHELADHYLEMIKGSLYKKQNVESIRYTLYTVGLGVAKLFAPFFPHLTEEIYSNMYKEFEGLQSIHLSSWPEAILIDERKEQAGETVKEYIAKVRAWKSEQGMALNAPVPAIATYASSDIISRLQTNDTIIFSTLRYPEDHQFIAGKPEKHAKREGLLQAGYVQVKKEVGLKGKKGSIILSFDGFYLELQRGKL